MGVPGLWRLLEPAREPIELQQLSGKILAIDMNIWLHQAVKSRGAAGGPRNYLAIFFRRLCKLLFFGIKPVFVFDGETPALKRSTINSRRQLRNLSEAKAEKAQKNLLRRLLRRVAESSVKSLSTSPDKAECFEDTAKHELLRRLRQQSDSYQAKEDAKMFSAPSQDSTSTACNNDNDRMLSEKAGLEYDELARDYLDAFYSSDQKFSGVDLDSDAFRALPLPAQLRVVQMLRETLDSSSCRNNLVQVNDEAQFNPEQFSDVQMKRLLLRRRLAERQQELSDNLTKQEAVQQILQLNNSMIKNILKNQSLFSTLPFSNMTQSTTTSETTETIATAMRIQSQDVGHAILIKKSPVNQLDERTKLPSSTTLNLERLITYNTEDLNVSDECKKVGILKGDQNKEIPNDGFMSENPCSTQETNISTNKNIVYNSECTPIKLVNIEEYSDEHQVSITSHVTDNKSQFNDNCENDNKPPIKDSLNDDMSNEVLPESSSTISKFDKSSDFIELSIPEHSSDLIEVRKDEITAELNVLSSDIHESESLQVLHQDKYDEIKSSSDDNDDDFIEVETHEQVEISNTSTDSNLSQEYSVDENNAQNEDKINSVVSEEELVSNEVTYETNQQETALSSELPDDDYTIDDDVLREKADRLTRQAQSTTTRCISEAQDLLHLFGFPFVVSPEEAEAQCVALQRHGLVDLVASDDSDVWPFGVKLVCRHLFGTGGGDNLKSTTNPSIYKLDEVKRKLGLTIENILRLTLLCGSDYTHGIDQVGPVTAIEILSEFDVGDDDSLNCEINNWLHGVVDEPSEKLLHDILQPLEQFTFFSYTHLNTLLGWNTEKTEALLASVLKRRQNVELGNPRGILSSKSLITNFFQIENQKLCQKSEIASHHVDSSELDEVTVPSKRVRHAASRLRNQRTTDQSLKAPNSSQHTTPVKDENSLLSELPKLRQPRRRQSVKKPPSETKTLAEKKRKEKAQIKPQRRVVERVCLSEEDED
ncbi:putative xp-G/rad2 DNA repair endonuclease family [Schistosoma mansoni]|uniref:putative xp-G/rad2 DNA repair endonuclease family n=1 Tax=Schistosoma mansoni TaxID=6183 RepID=UPI0001A64100|nr:putative xp-G/rad2 DNA repair endonuclease family [Schistosoma mansoni]|eukprot:XP_018647687.1 putative xp-G/rad2 DNA repair endonuclease family [Schistosoma mansoni]